MGARAAPVPAPAPPPPGRPPPAGARLRPPPARRRRPRRHVHGRPCGLPAPALAPPPRPPSAATRATRRLRGWRDGRPLPTPPFRAGHPSERPEGPGRRNRGGGRSVGLGISPHGVSPTASMARSGTLLLVLLVAAGCGTSRESVAPVAPQISAAQDAAAEAEQAGAATGAALELREARQKIERAQQALDAGDDERALRLAEQAEVDAELAEARARAARRAGGRRRGPRDDPRAPRGDRPLPQPLADAGPRPRAFRPMTKLAPLALALLVAAGCSGPPAQNPRVDEAREALRAAEAMGAAEGASVAYARAREAYERAESARLLKEDEARVDHLAYLAPPAGPDRPGDDRGECGHGGDHHAQRGAPAGPARGADGRGRGRPRPRRGGPAARPARAPAGRARAPAGYGRPAGGRAPAPRGRGRPAPRAEESLRRAQELAAQVNDLQAQLTNRGLVLTLGDVLFDTGRAGLKPGRAPGRRAAGHVPQRLPRADRPRRGVHRRDRLGRDEPDAQRAPGRRRPPGPPRARRRRRPDPDARVRRGLPRGDERDAGRAPGEPPRRGRHLRRRRRDPRPDGRLSVAAGGALRQRGRDLRHPARPDAHRTTAGRSAPTASGTPRTLRSLHPTGRARPSRRGPRASGACTSPGSARRTKRPRTRGLR